MKLHAEADLVLIINSLILSSVISFYSFNNNNLKYKLSCKLVLNCIKKDG